MDCVAECIRCGHLRAFVHLMCLTCCHRLRPHFAKPHKSLSSMHSVAANAPRTKTTFSLLYLFLVDVKTDRTLRSVSRRYFFHHGPFGPVRVDPRHFQRISFADTIYFSSKSRLVSFVALSLSLPAPIFAAFAKLNSARISRVWSSTKSQTAIKCVRKSEPESADDRN